MKELSAPKPEIKLEIVTLSQAVQEYTRSIYAQVKADPNCDVLPLLVASGNSGLDVLAFADRRVVARAMGIMANHLYVDALIQGRVPDGHNVIMGGLNLNDVENFFERLDSNDKRVVFNPSHKIVGRLYKLPVITELLGRRMFLGDQRTQTDKRGIVGNDETA